ncbi:hypothetical protein GQ53DRAFT_289919 [Thozetella sp. PMI_491]|nr:hypothetical protein GQ53DRAFT_289919 [Thozetella sp. PMI_491]
MRSRHPALSSHMTATTLCFRLQRAPRGRADPWGRARFPHPRVGARVGTSHNQLGILLIWRPERITFFSIFSFYSSEPTKPTRPTASRPSGRMIVIPFFGAPLPAANDRRRIEQPVKFAPLGRSGHVLPADTA